MQLYETVKNFLNQPGEDEDVSSVVHDKNVIVDLTDHDMYPNTGAFFDAENTSFYSGRDKLDKLEKQKEKIMQYRNLAKTPDVNDAVEEIVNETIFSFGGSDILTLELNEENEKIEEAITEKFNKILRLLDVEKNMYKIVKNAYVDGQIVLHHAFSDKNTKDGIKYIKMIEPVYFYFDKSSNTYKYYDKKDTSFFYQTDIDKNTSYSYEEITRGDFGLYEDNINLSYLEYAIKPANMLRNLEDLLIPMRFSRSVSRRVFNVDIGDLPNTKGEQVMREMQNKFKYKKFYNVNTGEITNQQHITSMVEDYWFANRSGGKGTQVDTLDETGNLGELDDILYFNRKLYKSLYIPSNRISIDPDSDKSWDYNDTRVTQEDVKFFMFISRVRKVFTSIIKDVLKKELISTGVMSEDEWDDYSEKITISFINENTFIEKMYLEQFTEKVSIYENVKEEVGKLIPMGKIYRDVFKYSEQDVDELFKEMEAEKKDKRFEAFYKEGSDF